LSLLGGIDNTERLDALKGVVYNGANPTNLEEFSREIDETLRLAPTESMILGYRGWIRFKQGRIEEGIKDYSMAAELGDAYSQFQHGQQLFYGVPPSLTPNRNQGLLWITKAAEQGDEAAKQFLKQVGEKQ
jgi:TPR repeat protein